MHIREKRRRRRRRRLFSHRRLPLPPSSVAYLLASVAEAGEEGGERDVCVRGLVYLNIPPPPPPPSDANASA